MGKEIRKVALFCVFLAVCIAVLAVYSQVIKERKVEVSEEFEPEEPESPAGHVSVVTSIEVQAVPENWDDDAAKDGLMLYITFYDEHGNLVEFENTEYSIRIRIYRAEPDSDGTMVKGDILYDFCCPPIKKHSSYQVGTQGGITISLNLSEHADEWGIIGVEVEIPGIGIFYAEGEPVPLSP
ncbi:MAG: hypothetical protein HXS46_09470 [Theionarchaea archaeon]|nr:hypothetical protein [Theionarchaea archaeon]